MRSKTIRGGEYTVYEDGRIFNNEKGRFLNTYMLGRDSNAVSVGIHEAITGKYHLEYVCNIILETFVGPRPSKAHVACHIDGNPLNNHLDNLMWTTHNTVATRAAERMRSSGKSSCIVCGAPTCSGKYCRNHSSFGALQKAKKANYDKRKNKWQEILERATPGTRAYKYLTQLASEVCTMSDIAEKEGLSRERVRQIILKVKDPEAYKAMRKAANKRSTEKYHNMTYEQKQKRYEAEKQWRFKNPDKVKEYQEKRKNNG